jgi:hypothetical protein
MKCGQPVGAMDTDVTAIPIVDATLGCSKCGSELPEDAQFCLKCGKAVGVPANQKVRGNSSNGASAAMPPQRKRKRHLVLWSILALFLICLVWAATSENPFAQGIQEFAGWKHDEIVLDAPAEKPFSLGPRAFRYYKFSLPQGSLNVAMVGQFKASAEASGNRRDKGKDNGADNTIEVYVLTDTAFTVWQNGYATSSLYESGRVAEGTVNGVLPAGAGVYYLVFSNRFSSKTPKNVSAALLLRYKSWFPESIRRGIDRFWNWLGL